MKTQDIFSIHRSSRKLNEGFEKFFGQRINLEAFDLDQLQDARNRIRTQFSQIRTQSGFNENIENEDYQKSQWILDALNSEIAEREYIVDSAQLEQDEIEESTQGEIMQQVTEGELQQASAIVTAKTMVDKVGRWIEELSNMENETLLQLGDSIRDEMGLESSKAFIETVAPAIQQALDNLKQTRDALSTGVRNLATGESPAPMLGTEPDSMDMGMDADMPEPADMDAMNSLPPEDEFGAADAAAGGLSAAGREKRESIEYQNKLLKVLAG